MTKLKIGLISEHASPLATLGGVDAGGQNVYVAQVAQHLAALGHAVDVYTRRDNADQATVVDWQPGIRVIHVAAGPACFIPKERMLFLMSGFTRAMLDHMHRESLHYDVMHANFFMSALVAANIRRHTGIPYVVTFHALGKVRRLHQGKADGFPHARLSIEEKVARNADAVIAECPQDHDDLMQYYRVKPEKIEIIPGGFDPAEFWPVTKSAARQSIGLAPQQPTVLYLGRIVPRKGVDTVIEAFALLHRRGFHSARLLVVGGDSIQPDPQLTPELGRLQELARQQGVHEQVHFTGLRPRSMLRLFYSAADMFVTAPWYEPFGITPLEAMACGTPVIGSSVGGLPYTIRDGQTGFLVPPKNPAALADKMAELYANPASLQAMAARGVRHVRERFTWRIVAQQLEALYTRVAEKQIINRASVAAINQNVRHRSFHSRQGLALLDANQTARPVTRPPHKKAIFLDKDGTLVENIPYNVMPERIRLMPRAMQGLRLFCDMGFELIVVSNQAGVAFGFFPEHMLQGVENKLRDELAADGIPLAGCYWCPHHPRAALSAYSALCTCRKPAPGLLRMAARDLHIDLEASWMIGDILDDVEAGRRADCRTVLIDNGGETEWKRNALRIPHITAPDLYQAALAIGNFDKALDLQATQLSPRKYETR
ncbi:MAG: HAD-IIIA family hydrolase [Gammaproteobacteria bacterium]|nr:HAD-IIIA family hydrolase [Gammaproteobacteria bacterium]